MSVFNSNFFGLGRSFYLYRSGDCFFLPVHLDNRNKRIYGYAFNRLCVSYISADFFVEGRTEYFNCWFPDFEHWIIFSSDDLISWTP